MTLSDDDKLSLVEYDEVISELHTHLRLANRFPHADQFAPLRAIFNDKKRYVMGQWGRSGGKTETMCYAHWRTAATIPYSPCYIQCPEKEQAESVYWKTRRLPEYGPEKLLRKVYESDNLLEFKNGSIIQLGGAKNYKALRGIKPRLMGYDETQDHSKEFHYEVMEPNMAMMGAQLLIFGTPPKRDCFYVDLWKQIMAKIAAGDPECFYTELPSWVNPKVDRSFIEKKRLELIAQGDEKVYLREYEGKMILGGEDAVYPRWDKKVFQYDNRLLSTMVERDRHKLRWYTICDPGTSSCFAVLFACHNQFTSQLFILGEIYEKDRKKTDSRSIWEEIRRKEEALYPGGHFIRVYDEAAAWFALEISKNFRVALSPTQKSKSDKDRNISLVKTMMATPNTLFVSQECPMFCWELDNYVTDEKGNYPKDDDHLHDCLMYLLDRSSFTFTEKADGDERVDLGPLSSVSSVPVRKLDTRFDNWDDLIVNDSYDS